VVCFLNASETVFIDDMKENLSAAEEFGLKTIHFTGADQCKQALQGLGVFRDLSREI
jgi:FMN phosphatase YigB (HAD superfamily)